MNSLPSRINDCYVSSNWCPNTFTLDTCSSAWIFKNSNIYWDRASGFQYPLYMIKVLFSPCGITFINATAAAAKSLQSCPTLCSPIDSSPPGFPVPGILQARTLEWFAISFSNAWWWKVKVKSLSCVRLFMTP